jgi:hypothetical protein
LTSKLIAKEIPYCNHIVPVFKPIKPVHTADKNITSPNNAENEIPNKEGGDEEKFEFKFFVKYLYLFISFLIFIDLMI